MLYLMQLPYDLLQLYHAPGNTVNQPAYFSITNRHRKEASSGSPYLNPRVVFYPPHQRRQLQRTTSSQELVLFYHIISHTLDATA